MFKRLKLYLVQLLMLVSTMISMAQPNVIRMEYYVDADPGPGSRVDIPLSPATTLDLKINVPTSTLSEGFHVLTILVQDANLVWSHYENKVFYVSQSSTLMQNNISKIEYFVDADPGQGAGVDVPITVAMSLDFLENVSTASLSEGFHLLTVRAQDANGLWSLTESKIFFVNQSVTLAQNDISKIEYFIDADPGQGAGVDIPITAAMSLDILENVPTASLDEGFHLLTVRAQDDNGQWSLTESKVFFVNQSASLVQNDISKIEYFIGADPGHGAGVDVPITTAMSLDFLENVSTASLSDGFHLLTIRAQDAHGQWSLSENKTFFVDRARQIVSYEYAVDIDPGVGLANTVMITQEEVIDITFDIPTGPESLGPHNLLLRVKDENEFWSKTEMVPFTLCDGAISDFSVVSSACPGDPVNFTDLSTLTQSGDVYSWDFDGDGFEDDNTGGDVSFSYLSTGTYSVTMTVDRLGCISSVTKTITITDVGCNEAPVISYIFYLDENSPNAQLVGAVTALDPEGDPLTYSIISGNTNDAFAIDAATGNLTVNTSSELDFETTPVFNLVVEANDGLGGSSMVSITINLKDIDENVLGIENLDSQVVVYPNPASESLFIELKDGTTHDLQLQFYSLSGNLILDESQIKSKDGGRIELDLSRVKPGIYLLKIENKFEVIARNILVR